MRKSTNKRRIPLFEEDIRSDPFLMLMQQHRDAENLFEKIEHGTSSERKDLFAELSETLMVHMELEEQVFYPAAAVLNQTLIEHSRDVHAQVRHVMQEIDVVDCDDDRFLELISILKRKFTTHVEEEEDLFPLCKSRMTVEKLSDLYDEMDLLQDDLNDVRRGPAKMDRASDRHL